MYSQLSILFRRYSATLLELASKQANSAWTDIKMSRLLMVSINKGWFSFFKAHISNGKTHNKCIYKEIGRAICRHCDCVHLNVNCSKYNISLELLWAIRMAQFFVWLFLCSFQMHTSNSSLFCGVYFVWTSATFSNFFIHFWKFFSEKNQWNRKEIPSIFSNSDWYELDGIHGMKGHPPIFQCFRHQIWRNIRTKIASSETEWIISL